MRPIYNRVRPPKINSAYYLPTNIFRSAVAFCLSYKDFQRMLREFTGMRSPTTDAMPRGSETSDPTYKNAIKEYRLREKIEIIEDSVRECSGDVLYPYMLRGITDEGCTWATQEAAKIPLERTAYFALRRKIYYTVAQKM